MPTLLHLNGPPGIGKSTLARLWADRHPPTLDLEQDVVFGLVGGWDDLEQDTHPLVRPVVKAMAATYLAGGHDVVLPQYLGRLTEIEAFEEVAVAAGARFREVVLLDDRVAALARFEARDEDSSWNRHNRRTVAALGGDAFLGGLYDQLLEVLDHRPNAVVLRSRAGATEETYAELKSVVGRDQALGDRRG